MRILAIGGKFDDHGGKPSSYAKEIFSRLCDHFDGTFMPINGGSWEHLREIINLSANCDVIFWFCEVDNSKPKLLHRLKEINPRCILVSSKNNIEGKYGVPEIIAHCLKNKNNLLVEFTLSVLHAEWEGLQNGPVGEIYAASIFDPLGNIFLEKEIHPGKVAKVLSDRVKHLSKLTRMPSISIGSKASVSIPDDPEFFEVARSHAETFHNFIHTANQSRLLGNISFRCESGFPSIKTGDLIFVSRRNIYKRDIDKFGCVAVTTNTALIEYYGDDKPSVDTPIQVNLYKYYENVKYILHSHAYIKDAPFTKRVLPCGVIEEFDDIRDVVQDWRSVNFSVNLRGHGSIVLAESVDYIRSIKYIARPMPERQGE